MNFSYLDLAKMIDHSILHPTMDRDALVAGINLAKEFDVASVCIMPYALALCSEMLAGTTIKPSTTIGFPHGGHATSVKVAEAQRALADGGQELDMVVNISQVLSGQWDVVAEEIREITAVTHAAEQKVKVIFENCYLNTDQKVRLCEICGEIGVDWVKTSTGFGTSGATDEDLILMRAHSPESVQVKAAGGVRDLDRLIHVRGLGVTRVGTSGSKAILEEHRRRLAGEEASVVSGSGDY